MPQQHTSVTVQPAVTFVVAVNDRRVFENNFLASPCLASSRNGEILVQEGFRSAAKAYNSAIDRATNDLIVFCHQDMLLPEAWLNEVLSGIQVLESREERWGVVGVYGNKRDGSGWGFLYSSGLNVIGQPFSSPIPVQTLDEIVLIIRKSSGLRFDESLPHFHFYGTDLCLRASGLGMTSYAVSAFCIHNTQQPLVLPKEFYQCYRHIKHVWKEYLPIQTSCVRITGLGLPVFARRLRECYLRYVRRKIYGGTRIETPTELMGELVNKRQWD